MKAKKLTLREELEYMRDKAWRDAMPCLIMANDKMIQLTRMAAIKQTPLMVDFVPIQELVAYLRFVQVIGVLTERLNSQPIPKNKKADGKPRKR